jgi:membrane-bound lytic murein transglycosylase MltF
VNLIELVSLGQYEATVSDTVYTKISKSVFNNITILKTPLKSNQKIAWAVRKKSSNLLEEVNLFIPKIKNGSYLGNMLKKRYFNDVSRTLNNQKLKRISKFDTLLKKYAKIYKWDWRLLASLCFQESRFNQKITNKWGAIGLFQIKQMTANEPYINIPNISGIKNVEHNIHAGVKYLSWIKNRYFSKKSIPLKDQYRLTMAAYNAGPARVRKAIKLAKKLKLNPNKWFRNVEYAMAHMRKLEPVYYVSEINKRYVSYKILGY